MQNKKIGSQAVQVDLEKQKFKIDKKQLIRGYIKFRKFDKKLAEE